MSMTDYTRDSLDDIRHEMIYAAQEIATAGADSELPMAAHLHSWAARIQALIPSKAEREFLEAAWDFCKWEEAHAMTPGITVNYGVSPLVRTYRALLAEREGKDG